MLEVTALGWIVTIGVIVALLALDLILGTVRPHAVGFREATAWSVFYIAAALVCIVEKSLSVDNLFVFVIIMSTFAVPEKHQHKVLTFGILIALVLRVIFIALGATLPSAFSFMFLVFGLLLVYTAVQLFRHRDEDPSVEDNALVKATSRVLPVSEEYVGGRIVTRLDRRRAVTPLFIVLIAIGSTDLLFALDSIPAVFGVTERPYIVFVANASALLGLRALFFLVKGLLDRLVHLSTGLALILAFIGVKLILHWAHTDLSPAVPEIATPVSLTVIVVVLVVTTVASVIKVRRDPAAGRTRAACAVTTTGRRQSGRGDALHPRTTAPRRTSVRRGVSLRGDLGLRVELSAAIQAGGVGMLPCHLLAVEDLPDLPGLLHGVPADHEVELGAFGRGHERREFVGEPPALDPFGAPVQQCGAHGTDLGGDLHDPAPDSE